jgi:hypothetical protein
MITHGLIVEGAGGTAAATKTQIGSNITMPAGGPFIIHNIFGTAVKDTTIPDEGTQGELIIDSYSGDVSPDPAPGKFPLPGNAISSSANAGLGVVPLTIWFTEWNASGKAVLQLSYLNILAMTTGSDCVLGILFGEATPEWRPAVFCDGIYSSFASATEQLLGTITLSEKAKKITGILADLNKGDAATAGVPCVGHIRLASNDINFAPGMFPCNRGFDATDGVAVGAPSAPQSDFIPVDITVPGGAIINIYGKTTASVTGNADFAVFLAYE